MGILIHLTLIIAPQNKCFCRYTVISLSVCPSVRVSACVQNTTFCQSTGGAIKSHPVTALVFAGFSFEYNQNFSIKKENATY